MEGQGGPSNGGMLYHEVQESKLCAVHCVNTVLQGPFFVEFDLAALASDLDSSERQMMIEGAIGGGHGDYNADESHNVSLGGDFSIQVLQKALEVWDLQVISLDSPMAAKSGQFDPELEDAFICHLEDHWFTIRKVNGEWYNFDSLYAAPEHLSRFYLSAYIDSLKAAGWSIFLVRGNFPKDCPLSPFDGSSNRYGQWLTPQDCVKVSKSGNGRGGLRGQSASSLSEAELIALEDDGLEAAIAASLMDSTPAMPNSEPNVANNSSASSSADK